MQKGLVMWEADETSMNLNDVEAFAERELFVENLGWLLRQTREGIVSCILDSDNLVHVRYKHGPEKLINVEHDSFKAIVYDVLKGI